MLFTAAPLILGQQPPPVSRLIQQFEGEKVFWRQFEIAKAIAERNDPSILPRLEPWLTHNDRHFRGNAAFIFGRLGDRRGFDVIVAILGDHSETRIVDTISSNGRPFVEGQIREDRYYAAHLLGDLKDPRAIPILVPLLAETGIDYIVPRSLAQIGGRSAIAPLIATLSDRSPSMRVLAIKALADLKATEALPHLRLLLNDQQRCDFDKSESVAEAAKEAITAIQPKTAR
ncbi:HEAT repeat domain-containing protein [Paludibaculum fermentans]|uniref:HEAT repeat domain-containing protein n=1 Tax=Paludibaculum fermentans TaxID=1473598 RepID=A0A7S7NV51_PALFE|nr:HEAT repeat domain-containing protein [Paludibaculum fermentans]QOY90372.1 HEAT repeat domain-containing protein [Paludibaculum fermentans]